MKATAAVMYEVKKPLVIEEVELLEPESLPSGRRLRDALRADGGERHPDSQGRTARRGVPGVLAGAGPVFNRAKVPPGASVAVWGCGGVGLNTIQAARLVGAGKIIGVDVMKQKLAWAEEFGATHVVDASREDPVARVQALSGRGGVDFAFEVVGTQRTVEQALLSTHRGGTCVVVGVSPAGTRLSIDPSMLLQQRVLTGSSFGGGHQRTDVPMLIDLYMSGKYRLDELISRRLPLGELNRAFDLMLQGEVKRSVIVYS